MKTSAILIVCVLSLFAAPNCTDNPNNLITTTDTPYPVQLGGSWVYSRTFSTFNVRPDSLRVWLQDTSIASSVVVEITGTATLLDSIKVSVFRETLQEGAFTHVSDHYYATRDSGLYFVAYRGPGNVIPKGTPKSRFLFDGIPFNDLKDVTCYIMQLPPRFRVFSDSLIYEIPPLLSLKYPLSVGLEWTFRPAGRPWRIDKRVLRRELVQVPAGLYKCFVIQWVYPTQTWGSSILFLDYVAEIGLVKRSVLFRDMIVAAPDQPGQIGVCDNKDESVLIRAGF